MVSHFATAKAMKGVCFGINFKAGAFVFMEKAKDKGVKLFHEDTPKAVDIFNAMVATGKKAVAFIHTTS